MIEGIDISHWNWSKLIKERFPFNTYAISNFIIMKATQGLRYKDDKMIRFSQEIFTPTVSNYDKHIGFYHFPFRIRKGLRPSKSVPISEKFTVRSAFLSLPG